MTLPDGTRRSGQVLEVSGSKAVVQVRLGTVLPLDATEKYFINQYAFELCQMSCNAFFCTVSKKKKI